LIHETHEEGWLRLSVIGELDLATAPVLKERLGRLHAPQRSVRLDLSKLEFMDSTGLGVLALGISNARTRGCQLQVEPDLSPGVRYLFELACVSHIIWREESSPD
jgi:anti-sigma B factor antagonist